MDHTQDVSKKLPSFAITSNFHSEQKSKWVLKGKCLVTRSNKTDEKYGLWWKTNRCMFYWHDKCGKTRCGIPYNIILNVLKYIFLQRSFFFFFSHSYSPFWWQLLQVSWGPQQKSLQRFSFVLFFSRKCIESCIITLVQVRKSVCWEWKGKGKTDTTLGFSVGLRSLWSTG